MQTRKWYQVCFFPSHRPGCCAHLKGLVIIAFSRSIKYFPPFVPLQWRMACRGSLPPLTGGQWNQLGCVTSLNFIVSSFQIASTFRHGLMASWIELLKFALDICQVLLQCCWWTVLEGREAEVYTAAAFAIHFFHMSCLISYDCFYSINSPPPRYSNPFMHYKCIYVQVVRL